MTNVELDRKVQKFKYLKEISEQLENDTEHLKNEIKAEMERRDVNTLNGVDWRIFLKEHTLTRFDEDLLEKDFGDLSKYKKITRYKSFHLKDK